MVWQRVINSTEAAPAVSQAGHKYDTYPFQTIMCELAYELLLGLTLASDGCSGTELGSELVRVLA